MIVLYIAVLLFYIILSVLSFRDRSAYESKNIFERMAGFIYERYAKKKVFFHSGAKESLHILNPEIRGNKNKENTFVRQFYVKRIGLTLLLIFIGDVFALCLFIGSCMEGTLVEGRYINRNAYGMGSTEANLRAQIEENGMESRQDFSITVEEQEYEEALIKEMAKEVTLILPEIILGSNASAEEVRNNLNLVEEVEGYPFHISWESDNYSYLYSDGCVMNEQVEDTGAVVSLTAILTYRDYKEEHILPVHIYPPRFSEEEILKRKIYELLMQQEEKDRYLERMELPDNVNGTKLIWSERIEDSSGYILLLMCVGAVLIYILQERELKDKMELRNRQMLLDYPRLISKITLYMGAGMTIRNAFRKIALDYRKEKKEDRVVRYVYEEMLLTCYEMDSGISETAAYEHFGKRCRLPQYTKFANLLVQNLKKGSNSVLEALQQEAKNAFEERKNTAKKLGEEAGTKLLLPMMLMLGIVMILIIIPAYFSFTI